MLGVKEGTEDKGCEVFLSRHQASVWRGSSYMFGEAINTFLFFLRFNLCICLWLHWVFVAIPRLSLAAARKKIFCLGGGWATLVACRLLIAVASLVELGLSSGAWA